jgi:hypothetical protein
MANLKRNFKLPFFKIHRGQVPEILCLIDSWPLAYFSINMGCAAVEIAEAERLWPSLVQGGSILLDDFAFPSHQTQAQAFYEFAAQRGEEILVLPTGQGLIIKN